MAEHIGSRKQVIVLDSREWSTVIKALEYTMVHEGRGNVAGRCRDLLRDFNRLGWEHQRPDWMSESDHAEWLANPLSPIPVGPPDWSGEGPLPEVPDSMLPPREPEGGWQKHLFDDHGNGDTPQDHGVETYEQLHNLMYPDAEWCQLWWFGK
jgi:hypothetical protein